MKRTLLLLSYAFNFMLLGTSICPLLAKAPETAKIIISTYRDGNMEVYLMDPDGSQPTNLTNHRAADVSGVFSPTGEQILFVSNRDGFRASSDLYLMDPDGGNIQRVFETSTDRGDPTWAPDGKHIAYRRLDRGVGYIYIATSDGKNEERVAIGGDPTWSLDGAEIAFVVSVGPERLSIYLLNLRTRKQKHFFPPDEISTAREPAWSPDGEKLAFMWHQKRVQDEGEIYTLNRDGTDLQELVREPGVGVAAPVWSPRGDALVYRGRLKQVRQTQVFKVELGGRQVEQLTIVGIWNFPTDWFDPAYALSVSPQPHLLTTQWAEVKRE